MPNTFVQTHFMQLHFQRYLTKTFLRLIVLKCKNEAIGGIIDKFGKSLRIYKLDDRHFIAKFKAAPQGVIYWTMQYLSQVEIIEPEHMRQKAIEFIKSNPYGITAESERS